MGCGAAKAGKREKAAGESADIGCRGMDVRWKAICGQPSPNHGGLAFRKARQEAHRATHPAAKRIKVKARKIFRLLAWGFWALHVGLNCYAMDFSNALGLGSILAPVFLVVTLHEMWCASHERELASVYASYAATAALFATLDYSVLSMIISKQPFEGIKHAWGAIAGSTVIVALQIVLFVTARIHAGKEIR